MTVQSFSFFLPNIYTTFTLPNMFQLKIVENAKKNKQIATNIAPKFEPNTEPNAVCARFAFVIVVLAAAAPHSARGPSAVYNVEIITSALSVNTTKVSINTMQEYKETLSVIKNNSNH